VNDNGPPAPLAELPEPSPPPAARGPEESTLLWTLRLLRRRGWILAVVGLSTFCLAAVFTMTRPSSFRSEATIEVAPDRPLVTTDLAGDPLRLNSQLWENHFRTQQALLRRPGLLSRTLEALPPATAERYRNVRDPVRTFSEDLEIDAIPSTFLIRITLDQPFPDRGPAIVNRLVALFIEDSNRRLRELQSGALEILNREALPVSRQRVEELERRLESLRSKEGFGDLEERSTSLLETRRRLDARLSEVRLRRLALESGAEPENEEEEDDLGVPPRSSPELARTFETLASRRMELELELARQRGALREKHPAIANLRDQIDFVDDRLRRAARAAAVSCERDVRAAEREEQALAKEGVALDRRISEARLRLAEVRTLEAELAASREVYNSYVKKQGEVQATSSTGVGGVRVVELAAGSKESHRRSRILLTLGAVLGLLLGAGGILIAEQVDDRIVSPRQAEAALGLELLTVVPRLKPPPGGDGQPLLPEDDAVFSALEAFRRLRTEVVSRLDQAAGSRIVAVLSPLFGEGKSTVAINLARVLALEGRRVLLLDGDLRRPRLKGFLANEHAAGLEEFLRGDVTLGRCIQESRLGGVHVIGAEFELAGPAEIPGSARFRTLWQAVGSHYDYVVVDTGPVNAVSEAAVIASLADAALLVVEEGRTSLRDAAEAKRRLTHHRARFLGLVVNRSHAPRAQGLEPRNATVNLDRVDVDNSTFVEID